MLISQDFYSKYKIKRAYFITLRCCSWRRIIAVVHKHRLAFSKASARHQSVQHVGGSVDVIRNRWVIFVIVFKLRNHFLFFFNLKNVVEYRRAISFRGIGSRPRKNRPAISKSTPIVLNQLMIRCPLNRNSTFGINYWIRPLCIVNYKKKDRIHKLFILKCN